jgi:transposase
MMQQDLRWVELVPNIQSLTVMFAVMRCFNMIATTYKVNFKEVLTDNGSEFVSPNTDNHPFERMLLEMQIKHRTTRPYRPQTNGKVERLWRTIEDELLDDFIFDDLEHLNKELWTYLFYYNEHRVASRNKWINS